VIVLILDLVLAGGVVDRADADDFSGTHSAAWLMTWAPVSTRHKLRLSRA
jgi:hypothetical protein